MTIRRRQYGRNHAYYDTVEDGTQTKLDGVTTLLGDGLPKKALVTWAARTVAEYVADRLTDTGGHVNADELVQALLELNRQGDRPEKWDGGLSRLAIAKVLSGVPYAQRDAAANRGTEVHALAEKLTHGEQVDVPDEIAGHVAACVDFLDTYAVQPIVSEAVVVNRAVGYAGTLDLVADLTLGNGPNTRSRLLLDWKTSKDVYGDTALQLAMYRHAESYLHTDGTEHPMAELGIEQAAVVHLRADGYDIYPYASDERVFKLARHVALVARNVRSSKDEYGRWTSRLDEYKGRPLRPPLRSVS